MNDDRVHAACEIRENADDYREAYSYESGERSEVFASPVLRKLLAEQGSKYSVNIARRVIDAVLDRLKLAAVTVLDDTPEDGVDDAATGAASEALRNLWTVNELDLEVPLALRRALAYGDGYFVVWPNAEDEKMVDIFFNAPTSMRVFYDSENPRVKVFAAKLWLVDNGDRSRLTMYYPDRIERWITRKGTNGSKPGDFEAFVDDEEDDTPDAHIVPNPWGVVPVFHMRVNNRPYGRPEHREAYGPQDAITKLLATLMSTVDYHGAPQRYALTGRKSTDDVNDLWNDEEDETGAPDGANSNMRSGPGQMWFLRNVDSVGQLQPADVHAFLDPIGLYQRFASSTTATPMRYFDTTAAMPSGEAQRADEAPLINKVETHQNELGPVLADVAEFALRILGHVVEVSVRWNEPQSIDDLQGWQTANEKIKAGVPVRQALLEGGYTSAQVDDWLSQHDENDMKHRIEILVMLGQAVQSLGAGVALGVLTAENVATVIGSVIPQDDDAIAG